MGLDWTDMISVLRSCLISTKGQIPLRQLESDYQTIAGERINPSAHGYQTVEALLQAIPSLVVNRQNGQVFVDAVASAQSAHISTMVHRQKASKKPLKLAAHRHKPNYQHYKPTTARITSKWRPKANYQTPNRSNHPQNAMRLASYSHNQFVQTTPTRAPPSVSSRIVQPEPPAEKKADVSSSSHDASFSGSTNQKRRITKLMNNISLERDSGNSSPTTEYSTSLKSPETNPFLQTGDVVQDLKSFCLVHKLGKPEAKFTETKPKGQKRVIFHCRIAIDQHKYLSYPDDCTNEADAERKACEKALNDLKLKYGSKDRKSLLISSNDDIIERIPPMLEKHNSAVWMWQIEEDYIERFKEQLPSDWLQVIDSSSFVSIEKCPGGCVLKFCNPNDVLQKGKKLNFTLNVMDVSVPCNTVQFGDENRLYGVITAAPSTEEIWCQHFYTTEWTKFQKMSQSMEAYYKHSHPHHATTEINDGSCYATPHDSTWVRIRALGAQTQTHVDCFLIDYGVELTIPRSQIYHLTLEFAQIEAQAFVCRLSGLEELAKASINSDHLQALVGAGFVIEMVPEANDPDDVTIPVVMYEIESGKSINEDLIVKLTFESAKPTLEVDKLKLTEAYVSNIEANGDVYIQLRTFGFWRLFELLKEYEDQVLNTGDCTKLRACVNKLTCKGNVYLMENEGVWMRVSILDWSPNQDFAQIYYLDFGNTDVVAVRGRIFVSLKETNEILWRYPAQALKCRINLDKIPGDFVERAEKLMEKDAQMLVKIVSVDKEDVAFVEFFKRSAGILVCLNKSIAVEAELEDIDSSNNNEQISKKRLMNLVQFNDTIKNVPSGGSLKKPNLPKKQSYFNVNIPFAVNPWNYFIQPLESLAKLDSLMEEMQDRYKGIQLSPLNIADIIPGQIFASKHEDGKWYRTSVLKVIHSGSISVFFCDFGYYTNLTLNQLVPLDPKFMQLPYQAVKAKVSGIKPVNNKWTMEDCEYFRNLVINKHFVSVLVDIEKDELYRSDIVLKLILINTDGADDVNVKEVLIQQKIAISVDK